MSPKTKNPLRTGHVGVSRYGSYRRQTLKQSGLFEIAALHDWNSGHLAEAAAEDDAIACHTFEDLLSIPRLDVITISSGAKYHAAQIIAALRAGYPVFVEKPLCCTLEEVREIVAVQQETGLPIGLGHVDHSTNAISRTIKNLIEHGELGTIAAVEQTEAHSGGFLIQPGDWRGDANSNPGGMLFQCGVHAFHELMYHFGPITDVTSTMRYDVHKTDTADVAVCQVRFSSGLVSTLSAYHVTPYRHFLAIFGTKAALYRDDRSYFEGTKLLRQDVGSGGHEPQIIQSLEGTSDEIGNLRAFYRAVTTGQMQYPSLFDGARALTAVFAAAESAKTGQRASVENFAFPSNCIEPILS